MGRGRRKHGRRGRRGRWNPATVAFSSLRTALNEQQERQLHREAAAEFQREETKAAKQAGWGFITNIDYNADLRAVGRALQSLAGSSVNLTTLKFVGRSQPGRRHSGRARVLFESMDSLQRCMRTTLIIGSRIAKLDVDKANYPEKQKKARSVLAIAASVSFGAWCGGDEDEFQMQWSPGGAPANCSSRAASQDCLAVGAYVYPTARTLSVQYVLGSRSLGTAYESASALGGVSAGLDSDVSHYGGMLDRVVRLVEDGSLDGIRIVGSATAGVGTAGPTGVGQDPLDDLNNTCFHLDLKGGTIADVHISPGTRSSARGGRNSTVLTVRYVRPPFLLRRNPLNVVQLLTASPEAVFKRTCDVGSGGALPLCNAFQMTFDCKLLQDGGSGGSSGRYYQDVSGREKERALRQFVTTMMKLLGRQDGLYRCWHNTALPAATGSTAAAVRAPQATWSADAVAAVGFDALYSLFRLRTSLFCVLLERVVVAPLFHAAHAFVVSGVLPSSAVSSSSRAVPDICSGSSSAQQRQQAVSQAMRKVADQLSELGLRAVIAATKGGTNRSGAASAGTSAEALLHPLALFAAEASDALNSILHPDANAAHNSGGVGRAEVHIRRVYVTPTRGICLPSVSLRPTAASACVRRRTSSCASLSPTRTSAGISRAEGGGGVVRGAPFPHLDNSDEGHRRGQAPLLLPWLE